MAFDLASVLKDVPDLGTNREQIEYIKLDLLDEDPNNFYQLTNIAELAANIELCGLQQPIRVRKQESGRYKIVSGHRRRAAVEILVREKPDQWNEVPCIIETDPASPALQQLRLIYANSSTRVMTSAEYSKQAAEVTDLLYQLKEEGYEFPGRMRDHISQVVGVSKSKLSRLKVIRENLAKCWKKSFEKNNIKEDTAYKLARMPEQWQKLIYDARKEKTGSSSPYMYSSDLENHERNLRDIEETKCTVDKKPCSHMEERKRRAVRADYLWNVPCAKCCKSCDKLTKCKYSCPKLADLKKQKADAQREEKEKIKAEQKTADRPYIEQLKALWERFADCRRESGRSIESLFKAIGRYWSQTENEKIAAYENGKMEYPQFDVYIREASTAKSSSDGLDVVRRRAEELRDKGLEQGFTPWLIEETPYESVYGDTAGNNQQSAALVALLALGLLLAGNMSYEQQSGVTSLLLSTTKGRRALLARKILLAIATTTGIWAVIYGLELHAFFGTYEIDTLSASVQNLSLLDSLPQGCTIGMFLIMLYALRLLTLICAAMLTLLLSSCMKRIDVSYIAVCGVLLLPSLLYNYVGLDPLKYLSFTLPMGAMTFVQTANPLIWIAAVCGVMITLIGLSIYLLRKKLRV